MRLGALSVFEVACAQTADLPPIFAPRTLPAVVSSRPPVVTAPISDRVRGLITQRVLADAKAFPLPTAPATAESVARAMAGDAVMMEQLVVKASSLRVIESPPSEPPLLDFIKHGTLYHHVGQRVTTDISLTFLPVESKGYGNRETSTRTELRFSFRW